MTRSQKRQQRQQQKQEAKKVKANSFTHIALKGFIKGSFYALGIDVTSKILEHAHILGNFNIF